MFKFTLLILPQFHHLSNLCNLICPLSQLAIDKRLSAIQSKSEEIDQTLCKYVDLSVTPEISCDGQQSPGDPRLEL